MERSESGGGSGGAKYGRRVTVHQVLVSRCGGRVGRVTHAKLEQGDDPPYRQEAGVSVRITVGVTRGEVTIHGTTVGADRAVKGEHRRREHGDRPRSAE